VEVRLDCLNQLTRESVAQLFKELSDLGLPKIATVMPRTLFGRFGGDSRERASLLLSAADHAEYIDAGAEMGPALLADLVERVRAGGRAEVIISCHSDRPLAVNEITSLVKGSDPGTICKVVMPAWNACDNITALEACRSLEGFRRIVFCYNEEGALSRALSPLFGSEWTYASLKRGKETAPGQLDIGSLRMVQGALGP